MMKGVRLGIAGVVLLLGFQIQAEDSPPQKPHWRHPIAMVSSGERIYVANQKSGTISIVKADPLEVSAEIPIGQKLSDLKVLNNQWLTAVDETAHELLLMEPASDRVRVVERIDVAKSPVSIAVDAAGKRGAVSSLWSWRVTLFAVDAAKTSAPRLQIQATVDLPFAPRKMLWLEPENRLVVADAFGGRLAIVDPSAAKVLSVKELAGHNIRGLARSRDGKNLLISQQVLSAHNTTTHTPVFWGDLMQNVLRSQSVEELLSSKPPKEETGDLFRTEPLGHPSAATGDPYDVQVLPGGQTVVSLSGVGEIAIRSADSRPFERFEAEARSTALLLHPDGQRLLIANTFADSITTFDLKSWRIDGNLSLGPTPELTQQEWGEALFYDAKVSLDGWYSCHSCHTDGHTTGHRTDNQSDLSFGAPKRILPLGGVGQTGPWAWNGGAKSLAGQIHSSVENTMQGDKRTPEELAALESYVLAQKPAPSLDRMRGTLDEEAVTRGEKVFRATGCADCHQPPAYTSPEVYEIGLKDELGNKEFNPPSLLGVSQRQELFHDGRAKSLRDAFEKFHHGEAHLLSDKKRADLIAFLRSL